jgi:hypothetical protein
MRPGGGFCDSPIGHGKNQEICLGGQRFFRFTLGRGRAADLQSGGPRYVPPQNSGFRIPDMPRGRGLKSGGPGTRSPISIRKSLIENRRLQREKRKLKRKKRNLKFETRSWKSENRNSKVEPGKARSANRQCFNYQFPVDPTPA